MQRYCDNMSHTIYYYCATTHIFTVVTHYIVMFIYFIYFMNAEIVKLSYISGSQRLHKIYHYSPQCTFILCAFCVKYQTVCSSRHTHTHKHTHTHIYSKFFQVIIGITYYKGVISLKLPAKLKANLKKNELVVWFITINKPWFTILVVHFKV